jgi:U3 small nucleolar RNA-associated protein 19
MICIETFNIHGLQHIPHGLALRRRNHAFRQGQRFIYAAHFPTNDTHTTETPLKATTILLDFYTDSLSSTDLSLTVPALTGLFHLITSKNLDYPAFFPRLYALLTPDLLHSKYRSRVLRHLDTFLSPQNHLPATTIASFIKRLSRLCLSAPPAAIVAIIPFIYNLLKTHPQTTFLLHRNPYPPYTTSKTNLGVDPYDPLEPDPQLTRAIDSSLWELETMQAHYHPTVASIARIISEQFTKQQYNLEDFLDHGYASLLEGEFGKKEKRGREPVVEFRIPKRIFTQKPDLDRDDDEQEEGGKALLELWDFK